MSLDITFDIFKINKAEEPGVPTPQVATLRPNADFFPGMIPSSGTDNFAMIDDETADDDTTTLTRIIGTGITLAVGVPNPAVPTGATDISLKIVIRAKNGDFMATASFNGGQWTVNGSVNSAVGWTTYEDIFTSNPWDSNNPWTVENINLLDSINVVANVTGGDALITQAYLEVTYTPA